MLSSVSKMNTYTHRYELALKSAWSYKDIMEWCEVSKTTAIKIKDRAISKYGGAVEYGNHLAKTDSVLQMYGTTREREIELLRKLNNEELSKDNI